MAEAPHEYGKWFDGYEGQPVEFLPDPPTRFTSDDWAKAFADMTAMPLSREENIFHIGEQLWKACQLEFWPKPFSWIPEPPAQTAVTFEPEVVSWHFLILEHRLAEAYYCIPKFTMTQEQLLKTRFWRFTIRSLSLL